MSKITNIACDGCGKTLYGKDKAEFIKRPNLQINGQIVSQKVDPDSGYNYPIFITKTKEDRLNFCDLVCLQDFMEYKEKRYEEYKKEGYASERRPNISRGRLTEKIKIYETRTAGRIAWDSKEAKGVGGEAGELLLVVSNMG